MSYDGSKGPPNIDGMTSLKVDNLTYRTGIEQLKTVFGKYGDVGDIYIPRDRKHLQSRGFAFVRFWEKRDAEDAMDILDKSVLDGREIRVQMARYGRPTENYKPRQRSSYGSSRRSYRSRSRSHSPKRRRSRYSRSKSRSPRRRYSRSRSPKRRSRSFSPRRSRSPAKRSRSRSPRRSRSRSRSPVRRSRSGSPKRSPSRSPRHERIDNNGDYNDAAHDENE